MAPRASFGFGGDSEATEAATLGGNKTVSPMSNALAAAAAAEAEAAEEAAGGVAFVVESVRGDGER